MTALDQEWEEIRRQRDRQVKLKAQLERLKAQQVTLNGEVGQRKQRLKKEEQDVDQLEAFSWTALWARLNGQWHEKLSEQRQEAVVAAVRVEAACRQQEKLEARIARIEQELHTLKDCGKRWASLLEQKADQLAEEHPQKADALLRLEMRQREWERKQKELREAADAGEMARGLACQLVEKMDEARTWATVDLFGGGMITGFVKHRCLDEAQQLARQLEEQLRCFESELADVELHPSLGLTLDPFLRILDILFDSFVTGWTVSERVEKACVQAERTRREIQALLDHLTALQDQACRESAKLTRQRRLLIEQA